MEEIYSFSQPKIAEIPTRTSALLAECRVSERKDNVIADALSRVCPTKQENFNTKDSNIDVIPVNHITQSAPVSQAQLQEWKTTTESDPTLQKLKQMVHEGWQQTKKECPKQILEF